MSRGYSFLVARLLGMPASATPRPATSSSAARPCSPSSTRSRTAGWFWDTEFMVRAARRGLRIVEIPGAYIRREDKTSTVRGLRDSARLLPGSSSLPPASCEAGTAVKALGEIGWRRAARFGFFTLAMVPYRLALFPQLRAPWLRAARRAHRPTRHPPRRALLQPLPARPRRARDRRRVLPRGRVPARPRRGDPPRAAGHARRAGARPDAHERRLRGPPAAAPLPRPAAPVVVESGAFVGANVTVLPGVRIGRHRSSPPAAW